MKDLAFLVGSSSDFRGDAPVGAAVELGGAVIDVEGIDTEITHGKSGGLAASGRPAHDDHERPPHALGRSSNVGLGAGLHVGRELFFHGVPVLVHNAELLELLHSRLDASFGPVEELFPVARPLFGVAFVDVGPGELFFLDFAQALFLSLVPGYSRGGGRSKREVSTETTAERFRSTSSPLHDPTDWIVDWNWNGSSLADMGLGD